jgi:hypothetical protein
VCEAKGGNSIERKRVPWMIQQAKKAEDEDTSTGTIRLSGTTPAPFNVFPEAGFTLPLPARRQKER